MSLRPTVNANHGRTNTMETYIINCVRCNGAGTIISEKRGLVLTRRETCPECSGTGKKTIKVDL